MQEGTHAAGLVVAEGGARGHEVVLGEAQALDAKAVGVGVAVPGAADPEVAAVHAVVVGGASHITYLYDRFIFEKQAIFGWLIICTTHHPRPHSPHPQS